MSLLRKSGLNGTFLAFILHWCLLKNFISIFINCLVVALGVSNLFILCPQRRLSCCQYLTRKLSFLGHLSKWQLVTQYLIFRTPSPKAMLE